MSTAKKTSEEIISELQKTLAKKDKRIAVLEESLRLHKLKKLGASSEPPPRSARDFQRNRVDGGG